MLASKNLYLAVAVAVIAVGIAVFFAKKNSNALSSHLPPKQAFSDSSTALSVCNVWIAANAPNARVFPVSGTPSMQPYLVGKNNYLVVDQSVPFEKVGVDDFIVYRAAWDGNNLVSHVVAAKTSGGLIPSGINNAVYETFAPVTPANYFGKILFVASWP